MTDYKSFVEIQPELGEWDDYSAAVARLDACYTEACKGTPYAITVREAAVPGEAPGLCAETSYGLQILGYSIPVPEDIETLVQKAWSLFEV